MIQTIFSRGYSSVETYLKERSTTSLWECYYHNNILSPHRSLFLLYHMLSFVKEPHCTLLELVNIRSGCEQQKAFCVCCIWVYCKSLKFRVGVIANELLPQNWTPSQKPHIIATRPVTLA